MPLGQHETHGLLGDAKGGDRGDVDSSRDRLGVDVDEGPAHALAGVVDDNVGRAAKRQRSCLKQRADCRPIAYISYERRRAGLGGDYFKRLTPARRDRNAHSALTRESACEAGAEAGAGAYD